MKIKEPTKDGYLTYPKIHRLGKEETDGILDHELIVQEKVDGANISIFLFIETTTDVAEEMRQNWTKFMDTHHFVNASRGYAHNQWNKFYNFEDIGVNQQHRTAKFAVAFLRVMWQCEQFLLTGKFECNLQNSDLYPLLREIKPLSVQEIQQYLPRIVEAMSDMNMRVSVAECKSQFLDMKPDIKWIEEFIYRAYTNNN